MRILTQKLEPEISQKWTLCRHKVNNIKFDLIPNPKWYLFWKTSKTLTFYSFWGNIELSWNPGLLDFRFYIYLQLFQKWEKSNEWFWKITPN